jgi:hypothetical protein
MGDRKGAYSVVAGKTEGKRLLEDIGIVGRIILKFILKKWNGVGMGWIDLAQDRDRW